MRRAAVLSSLLRGTALAAAINSSDKRRLAWVGVYPLDLNKPTTREFLRTQGIDIFPPTGRGYRIRTFEVQRRLIEEDVSIGESDLENTSSKVVFDDEGLLRALEAQGVDVESLELPGSSDYPI